MAETSSEQVPPVLPPASAGKHRWMWWFPFALIAALVMGLGGGVLLDRQVLTAFTPPANLPQAAEPEFRLMAEAWNMIDQHYVDRSALDPQRLGYGAISGMTDALGDTGHSRFLSPQMLRAENDFTQGQLVGIGVEVIEKDGQLVIVAPLDGSPAQQAGLRPGDVIVAVNGTNVAAQPIDQVIQQIQGQAGTQLMLSILTPATGQTRSVTLRRARITLDNVTWRQLPGTSIAHLRVAAFSQGVGRQVRTALEEIQGAHMRAIILDLRDDPGGLVGEAVSVASQFLSGGNVFLEKNAQGQTTAVPVQPGGVATSIPIVVLVNAGTASAAEIVSGALQDAHRATVIGETTFGTGTVLNQFGLSDGSALLLATEEWLTPSGRVIWHHGLAPDQTVALAPDAVPVFPESEQGMTAEQFRASRDTQLVRALHILTADP
jgi:carboxyl-terminal processing protease